MGLYDVIGEITSASITKTETGDNRIYGVVVGIVAKNYEKSMPGRVCVTIPTRGEDKNGDIIKWARVAFPYMGKGWGQYFLPEVGDEVLLVFEQGNIEKPYVIGAIPRDAGSEKSKVLTDSFDEKNTKKTITTKHGSHITFTDNGEESGSKGEKDIITVETAQKMHKVILDNDKKKISISDEKGDNAMILETEKGDISIKCKNKLTINVGDNLSLILNGQSGKAVIKAGAIELNADTGDLKCIANKQAIFKGNSTTSLGGSMIKLESDGMLKLAGQTVKIGQ